MRLEESTFASPAGGAGIEANRRARKWSRGELVGRVLWAAVWPFFRYSPRLCWGWRRFLLRLYGARIGRDVQIHPTVQIFIPWHLEIGDWSAIGFDVLVYNLGPLRIGERVTVSQRVHLCGGSHDYRDPTMPLLKSPITIGDDAWICADAFVGPGVVVRERAVVGARAVVSKEVPPQVIVAGNPARVIKPREMNPSVPGMS